ncbi:MAG: hypothetical protein WBE72_13125 [Terracidiphilus sp.]
MPLLMTYEQWMKRTHSMVRPRSDSLKVIDEAIRRRDEAGAKKALISWIDDQNKKHQDWHRSVRNQDHAVEELYKQLGVLGSAVPYKNITEEMDDKLAKAHIRREQRLAAAKMFDGRTLRFKDSFWGISRRKCAEGRSKIFNSAKNVGKSTVGVGGNIASVGSSAYSIGSDLKTIIQTIMGTLAPETQSALVEHVFGEGIAQFVANVTPLFGVVSSGGKAIKDWVGVAQNVYQATEMESRYGDVRLGDASAALEAIVAIIDRQIKKQTADAAIHTTAFTAKGIAVLADGGTATTAALGAVETVAVLLNTLVDLVIDARQVDAGNALIAAKQFDLTLFSKCPILGCYYVAVQDHSTIMDFDFANMGKANWQQEAQRLRYAIGPVIKQAGVLIDKSRVEIKGMEEAKGVYQRSLWNVINLKYKSKGYGQSTNMPGIAGPNIDIIDAVAKGDI